MSLRIPVMWSSLALLLCSVLAPSCFAQCSGQQDHRAKKSGGILVHDFAITGTQSLTSSEVSDIAAKFTGACFDDDDDELQERLRAEFQNRGYFRAEITNFNMKPTDSIASPKPVNVEAVVNEGARYRLSAITFMGYRAFEADQLRKEFPLRLGTLFSRSSVVGGLESLRKLYTSHGYLDFTCIPSTAFTANQKVTLTVTIHEGQQYHMGKLEVVGPKDLASQLEAKWQLAEGSVYDATYLRKFLGDNQQLIPTSFSQSSGADVAQDCRDATVSIRLLLDPTHAVAPLPRKTDCDKDTPNSQTQ